MKELGACPRCNGTKINTLALPYKRLEVCNNCGFVDTYNTGGAQNVFQNFVAYILLGFGALIVLGLYFWIW